MDVMNPFKDDFAMMNEGMRVEKPCNVCGPTMILIVYFPINGL
jgi:hypothetical protein